MEQKMFCHYVMSTSEVPEKILAILLNHDFTVIGLSETWLKDADSDLYGLSGYKVMGHHRVNRAGGGSAVCVQDHVYFKERPDLSYFDEDCETVFIEMEKRHQLLAPGNPTWRRFPVTTMQKYFGWSDQV